MQAWAAQMFAQFESIKRKHRGETGRRREDDVREFLRSFLPQRLGIGTGEIAASDGSVSPQVDLIVYDALETPLLDQSESSIVVPVEGVFGVIEVSSRLDITKLREDVRKIQEIKALEKRAYWKGNDDIVKTYAPHGTPRNVFPVLGFCFGFEGNELDNLQAGLRQLDTDDLGNNLDMLCVLNQGCVANAISDADGELSSISGAPSPATQRVAIANEGAGMGGALMFFYLLAGGLLMQARTAPINMSRYLGRPS